MEVADWEELHKAKQKICGVNIHETELMLQINCTMGFVRDKHWHCHEYIIIDYTILLE